MLELTEILQLATGESRFLALKARDGEEYVTLLGIRVAVGLQAIVESAKGWRRRVAATFAMKSPFI